MAHQCNNPERHLIQIRGKKRWMSGALYAGAGAWRLKNRFKAPNSRRVLVFEPFGLGDMITFEPLVRELIRRDYEAVVCSRPQWRKLYPDQPGMRWEDIRVPFATHDEKSKYDIARYFNEPFAGDMRRLRKVAQGAIGIEPRGDIRCVALLYAMGCRRVLSLSNYLGSDLPMWRGAAEIVPFSHEVRRWELNLRFLEAITAESAAGVTAPFLAHLTDKSNRTRVALMPIAPWAGKWWPPERWSNVIQRLQSKNIEVVGLCGPNQSDAARKQVGTALPIQECRSIEDWAREFNRCAFVITLDSGPMHLADALQVPVIALFGQGKLPLWAPSGPGAIVLSHQDDPDFQVCHPIDANIPLGQKFMNRITVEEVMAAVEKVEEQIRRSGRLAH